MSNRPQRFVEGSDAISGVPADVREQTHRFLKGLCSHVVCLGGTAVPLDTDGRPCGQERFFSCSGFVVSLHGEWLWVTAGHVLKEIEGPILTGKAAILNSHLADYYGLEAKQQLPIPFTVTDMVRNAFDDDSLGLDIALVRLTDHYRRLLESNGVRAIPQDRWEDRQLLEFDSYGVLGFPEELFDRQRWVSPCGATVIGGVRPVLMMGKKTDALPRDKQTPLQPWLAVELKDKGEIKSILGMSGGPIFGFKHRPGLPPLYTIVAVQSWWDKDRRIAFGSSLPVMMGFLDQQIQALEAERSAGGS